MAAVGEARALADYDRELAEIEGLAATTLQRRWRRKVALWKSIDTELAELEAEELAQLGGAAGTIQRVWRGGCARRKLARLIDRELALLEGGGVAGAAGTEQRQQRQQPSVVDAPRPGSLPVTPVKLPSGSGSRSSSPADADAKASDAKAQLTRLCTAGSLSECYRLGSAIGTGGQSTVRQARCLKTGKDFAVKSLPKATSDHEAVLQECEIMVTLQGQPGVLQLVALYDSGSHHDLVLEYMQGGDLFSLFITSHRDKQLQRQTILEQTATANDGALARRHEEHAKKTRSLPLPLTATDEREAATSIHRLISFGHIDAAVVNDCVRKLMIQQFDAGEVIIEKGGLASSLFLIRSGEVEFQLSGSAHELGSRGRGECFGELGLLNDDKRCTVTALAGHLTKGCECFVLPKADFDDLLKQPLADDRKGKKGRGLFYTEAREAADVNFTEAEAAAFIRQIAEAVNACHAHGIVHRDLKPENILLPHAGGESATFMTVTESGANLKMRLKLADFGLATVVSQGEKLKEACGTLEFVAPEVVSTFTPGYGKPADLWSLGVLMYILLCGYPPFGTMTEIQTAALEFPESEWVSISAEAKDLLRSLLHRAPEQRPSASQLCLNEWVKGVVKGQDQQRLAPGVMKNIAKWNARRKLRAAFHAMVAGRRMGVLVAGLSVEKLVVDLAVHRTLKDVRELAALWDKLLSDRARAGGGGSTMVDKETFVRVVATEWSGGSGDRYMSPAIAAEHFDAFYGMETVKAVRAAVSASAATKTARSTNGSTDGPTGTGSGTGGGEGATALSQPKVSGTQTVNCLSYCLAMASLLPSIENEEKLTFAFHLFDRDQSGEIDKDEFAVMVKCLLVGKCIEAHRLDLILAAEFDAADVSGDGTISLAEFLTAAQNQPTIRKYFASLQAISRHTKQTAALKIQSFLRGWVVRKRWGKQIAYLKAQRDASNALETAAAAPAAAAAADKKVPRQPEPEPEVQMQVQVQVQVKPDTETQAAADPEVQYVVDTVRHQQQTRDVAAVKVQAAWRGKLVRKHVAEELDTLELEVLAELQQQEERIMAKLAAETAKEEAEEVKAVVKQQPQDELPPRERSALAPAPEPEPEPEQLPFVATLSLLSGGLSEWSFEVSKSTPSIIGRASKKSKKSSATSIHDCVLPGTEADKAISRKHAELSYDEKDDSYTLRCLGGSNFLFVNAGQVGEKRLGAKGTIESGEVALKDKDTIKIGSIELMLAIGPVKAAAVVDVDGKVVVARRLEPELASVAAHTTGGTVGEITRLQRELTVAKGQIAEAEAAVGAAESKLVESQQAAEAQGRAARKHEQDQGVALVSALRAMKAANASAAVGLAEAAHARKQAEAELTKEREAKAALSALLTEEARAQAAEAQASKAQLAALEGQLMVKPLVDSSAARAELAEARVTDLEEQLRVRTSEAAAASAMAAAAEASAGQARATLLQGKTEGGASTAAGQAPAAADAGAATGAAAAMWQAAAKADDPEAAVLQALHSQIGDLFGPIIASARARSALF